MPKTLFKESNMMVYQEDNGVLDWSGRYALFDERLETLSRKGDGQRNLSKHEFRILGPATLRVYLNTLGSNVKVRYSLLDSEGEEIGESSATFEEKVLDSQLMQVTDYSKPYTLQIEYLRVTGDDVEEELPCPLIELHVTLVPVDFAQARLQCTAQESAQSNKMSEQFTERYSLSHNYNDHRSIVIPSDFKASDLSDSSIYEDDYYIHFGIDLAFPPPMNTVTENAVLSVITQYNFAQIA